MAGDPLEDSGSFLSGSGLPKDVMCMSYCLGGGMSALGERLYQLFH